jgi:hypothetical protein
MRNTKIRTTLAALAAVAAVAAVTPAAQARPNDWRYSRSIEAHHLRLSDTYCGDMQALYDGDIAHMHASIDKGDYVQSFRDLDNAAKSRTTAKKYGCAWAWT